MQKQYRYFIILAFSICLLPIFCFSASAESMSFLSKIPTVPDGSITVNGVADDWNGIQPVISDPQNDSSCEQETDLKSLYLAKDSTYLYWRVDTWNGRFLFRESNDPRRLVLLFRENNISQLSVNFGGSEAIVFARYGALSDNQPWTQLYNGPEYGALSAVVEGKIPLSAFTPANIDAVALDYWRGPSLSCDNTIAFGSPQPPSAVAITYDDFNNGSIDSAKWTISETPGLFAESLNKIGIATLEIDMWTPRGVMGLVAGRPKTVPETLPDAYGAFKYLSGRPEIDAQRIGIMGFSFGGVDSMLTATKFYTEKYLGQELKFAAHVPFYPSCWLYNHIPGYEFNSFTGAPIFIQVGEKDVYDDPDTCPKLVQSLPEADRKLISIKLYPNATHEWNRLQPSVTYYDPTAYKGKGGEVTLIPDPQATEESRLAVLQFFTQVFGLSTFSPR